MPGNGNATPNETVKVLVRHFITEDTIFEGVESYSLVATNVSTGARLATGSAVIVDDGSISTTFAMGTSAATTRSWRAPWPSCGSGSAAARAILANRPPATEPGTAAQQPYGLQAAGL